MKLKSKKLFVCTMVIAMLLNVLQIPLTTLANEEVDYEYNNVINIDSKYIDKTAFEVSALPNSVYDAQPAAVVEPSQVERLIESAGLCNVIAEGQFADQEGANGIEGATWELCDDGVLKVGSGFINNDVPNYTSPWWHYRLHINKIIFTGSITAGASLTGLFCRLFMVTTIKGLEHFDTSQVTNMSWMFHSTGSLTNLDLSNFDTSQVTDMSGMFAMHASSVVDFTSLDLSNFDTSQVTDMSWMFYSAHRLTSLDLSSFDTSNVTDMSGMFWVWGSTSLRKLTLGEEFKFVGNAGLRAIIPTAEFTGYWQNVGSGTVYNPAGAHILTSEQLMTQFNGQTMADTFVWQPVNRPIDTLRELIEEAVFPDPRCFTPRSWANMQSALTFARAVYNNPTSTEAQINDAINRLRAAIDALELIHPVAPMCEVFS